MHTVQAVRVVALFVCVATRCLTGTAPASSTCSLDTLQRACRLLVFLGYYAPLQVDKDPTCDDIVRRLSNLDFFVDFSSSGLDARSAAAGRVLQSGPDRGDTACADSGGPS